MSDKDIRQEENIKNCPFCGCSVSVERVPLEHYKGCVIFEIKCLNCGCERTLVKNDSVYRTEEEARANAIAQWNERSSTAAVPQEMTAVEFLMAKSRMKTEMGFPGIPDIEKMRAAVAFVKKWAREHPEEVNNAD